MYYENDRGKVYFEVYGENSCLPIFWRLLFFLFFIMILAGMIGERKMIQGRILTLSWKSN